jgi:hypothetical protein
MAPENETEPDFFFAGIDSLLEIIPITNENYPSGESVKTWIEFYFETAEGAEIDLFSIMELFRIETSNNVIVFSPRQVKSTNFSATNPQPGWEDFKRIEISGNFINSTQFGLINFQIGAGLRDSLGNKNENLQRVSVIK